MAIINLPHGDNEFDSDELIAHMRATGRDYIIQGQKACIRADHPKPQSLDCWLRDNYAKYPNTKQAVNEVVTALTRTREFEEGKFVCPDSGRKCKGIKAIRLTGE